MQVDVWFPIAAWFSSVAGLLWILDILLLAPGRYQRWIRQTGSGSDTSAVIRIAEEPWLPRVLGGIFLLSLLPLLFLAIRKSLDFSIFLLIACALTGLVCLFDTLFLRRLRLRLQRQVDNFFPTQDLLQEKAHTQPLAVEYSRSFFPVLFIVLVLRSFLIEPYQIPSGSMLPTLQVGDFIAVNKFAYGLKLPVLGTKLVSVGDPRPGDIIVFKPPTDPSKTYIKRLIAGPGDFVRVDYDKSRLWVNGAEIKSDYLRSTVEPEAGFPVVAYEEQIGDVSHEIYRARFGEGNRPVGWMPPEGVTVPDGKYFAMGDNRDNSSDSRFFGFIDEQAILGKAFVVWVHWPSLGSFPVFSRNKWLD